MERQRNLFDNSPDMRPTVLSPATARNDPETSSDAERKVTESGQRTGNCNRVLSLVRDNPWMTSVELWNKQSSQTGCLDRHEVSRRLGDLKNAGKVVQGPARECTINHSKMVTWAER